MLDTVALARRFPDVPLWVETRSMLLGRRAEVFGFREDTRLHFLAVDRGAKLATLVGHPYGVIPQCLNGAAALLTPQSSEELDVSGWAAEEATLYDLRQHPPSFQVSGADCRIIDPAKSELPADLAPELLYAARFSPVFAVFVKSNPVSFCYGVPTETLWDVSIDTVKDYRGHGYATMCASFAIREMCTRGKRPVWAAMDSNLGSQKLAAKLGFQPVDRITVHCRED
jgi:GNAT superfamily N-acetyltransferase